MKDEPETATGAKSGVASNEITVMDPNPWCIFLLSMCIAMAMTILLHFMFAVSPSSEYEAYIPTELHQSYFSTKSVRYGEEIVSHEGIEFLSGNLPMHITNHERKLSIMQWNMSKLEVVDMVVDKVSSDYITIDGSKISLANKKLDMGDVRLEISNVVDADEIHISGKVFCSSDTMFTLTDRQSCEQSPASLLEDGINEFDNADSFAVSGRFVAITTGDRLVIYEVGKDKQMKVYERYGSGRVQAVGGPRVLFTFNQEMIEFSPLKNEFSVKAIDHKQRAGTVNSLGYEIRIKGNKFIECLDDDCKAESVIEMPDFAGRVELSLDELSYPIVIYGDAKKAVVFDSEFDCKSYSVIDLEIDGSVDDFHFLPYTDLLLVQKSKKITRVVL